MSQFIDKSAIVAEIESKRKYAQHLGDNAINSSMQQFFDGMKQGCVNILSFIDTLEGIKIDTKNLEVKDVDLGKEIDNYVKMNGYDGLDSIEEVKYIANHFAKWQKEQMISKMEQFLYEELNNGDIECSDMKFLILYFKKYMEE